MVRSDVSTLLAMANALRKLGLVNSSEKRLEKTVRKVKKTGGGVHVWLTYPGSS